MLVRRERGALQMHDSYKNMSDTIAIYQVWMHAPTNPFWICLSYGGQPFHTHCRTTADDKAKRIAEGGSYSTRVVRIELPYEPKGIIKATLSDGSTFVPME